MDKKVWRIALLPIKKTELTGTWNPNIYLYFILPAYFLVLYPSVQFFFQDSRWISRYAYTAFQTLTLLSMARKTTLKELGWSPVYLRQHLLIGGVCGAIVLGALPLLDVLFSNLSTVQKATGQNPDWPIETLPAILLLPLLEQTFFSGLIAQSLFKKFKPILGIYLAAVIFTLAHFTLNFGVFSLGFITTGLFYLTGTLYAPFIFQISCQLAGVLLIQIYPNLITFLGFLF